jgi:hypothetical protein
VSKLVNIAQVLDRSQVFRQSGSVTVEGQGAESSGSTGGNTSPNVTACSPGSLPFSRAFLNSFKHIA